MFLTMAALWELEKPPAKIILLDEPDLHLHPELQQQLAAFLVQTAERFGLQLFVATHSTTLLSALGHYGREKTSVAFLHRSNTEIRATKFSKYLAEIAGCLGGHALMGPLFSIPLLLVRRKGWSQACRSVSSASRSFLAM